VTYFKEALTNEVCCLSFVSVSPHDLRSVTASHQSGQWFWYRVSIFPGAAPVKHIEKLFIHCSQLARAFGKELWCAGRSLLCQGSFHTQEWVWVVAF